MNTRILRMCDRDPALRFQRCWRVQGVGEMHPTLFAMSTSRRPMEMRIEGAEYNYRTGEAAPVWYAFPLPYCRDEAKRAFAGLEARKRAGRQSPAVIAWEARLNRKR